MCAKSIDTIFVKKSTSAFLLYKVVYYSCPFTVKFHTGSLERGEDDDKFLQHSLMHCAVIVMVQALNQDITIRWCQKLSSTMSSILLCGVINWFPTLLLAQTPTPGCR